LFVAGSKGEGDNPAGMSFETCAADDAQLPESSQPGGAEHKLEAVQWQELGLEEFSLWGTKPVHVSYSIIQTGSDEGLVVVMLEHAGFLVTAIYCSQVDRTWLNHRLKFLVSAKHT